MIKLVEVTPSNLEAVMALEVAPDQAGLVAPNAHSIAEAHYEPKAWFRAICAGRTPVGFIMLLEDPPAHHIWRMMIGDGYQGQGYGAAAVKQIIRRARRTPGIERVTVSYVDLPGNPAPFYRSLGFRETGEIDEGEIVMALELN